MWDMCEMYLWSVKLRFFGRFLFTKKQGGVVFVGLQRLVVGLQRLGRLRRLGRLQRQLRLLGLLVECNECDVHHNDVQEMRKKEKASKQFLWRSQIAKKHIKKLRVWRYVYLLWLAICKFMKYSKSSKCACLTYPFAFRLVCSWSVTGTQRCRNPATHCCQVQSSHHLSMKFGMAQL